MQHTDGSLEDNIQKVVQYKEINDTEEDIELSVHGTSTSTVSKTDQDSWSVALFCSIFYNYCVNLLGLGSTN